MVDTVSTAGRSAPVGARSIRSIEDPAMRAYCTTLARFASSLSTTELSLQDSVAGARDDSEHRQRATAIRAKAIAKARTAAQDGYTHASEARAEYGLPEPLRDSASALWTGRAGTDLGPAVTSLARTRESLRVAATELDDWIEARDTLSHQLALGAAGVTAAVMAVVMVVTPGSGIASLVSPLSLVLLFVGGAAIAATAGVVAVKRQLPAICTGKPLARQPDQAALLAYAGQVGGLGLLALVVIRAIATGF